MKPYMIVLFLLISVPGLAQVTIISGTVRDKAWETLPGANVFLKDTYDGATTGLDGYFKLSTTEGGELILMVEFMGYEPFQYPVALEGKPFEMAIILKEAFNKMDAVTITAGAFEAGDKKRAVVLSSMDIATTAGAMADIAGAIQTLPGTSRVGESGRLYVRGGDSRETKTFIDGMLVSAPYFSTAPNLATRGRFNPFLFKGTTFNTGGYSAEYGQALSSVLLLNSIDEKQTNETNFSLLSVGADLTNTSVWEKGSITNSMSYFNLGPYITVFDQNVKWPKNPELYTHEVSLKLKTSKTGLFKLYSNINQSHLGVKRNNLNNEEGSLETFRLKNTNYLINSTWQEQMSDKVKLTTGITLNLDTNNGSLDGLAFTVKTSGFHAKAKVLTMLTERVDLLTGIDYNSMSFLLPPKTDESVGQVTNEQLQGYAELNTYVSNKLVIRSGMRMEHSRQVENVKLSPRFSAAYKLNKIRQLSFATGVFYQLPEAEDLAISSSLDYEKATHYMVNYQLTQKKRLLRSEVYYKDYSALTSYNVERDENSYANNGSGYVYGFDLFYRDAQAIKNVTYWLSYSYLDTERKYKSDPIFSQPNFASKHNFSFVYKHWMPDLKSQFGIDFSYSSPRNYNDPNQDTFNTGRTKSFQSLNANWAYLYREHAILYVAATNVLGRKNQFGYRFASMPDALGVYKREKIVPASDRFFVLGLLFTFSKDKSKNQLDKIN